MDDRERARRAKVVAKWRASGQAAAAFAAREGVTVSQIYAWSRVAGIDETSGRGEAPAFTELRVRERAAAGQGIAGAAGDAGAIEIVMGEVTVRVRAGADLELLAAVLGVLSRC
jgi:hypothetical protein